VSVPPERCDSPTSVQPLQTSLACRVETRMLCGLPHIFMLHLPALMENCY